MLMPSDLKISLGFLGVIWKKCFALLSLESFTGNGLRKKQFEFLTQVFTQIDLCPLFKEGSVPQNLLK